MNASAARVSWRLAALAFVALLGGCKTVGDLTGLATGGAVGAATANPAAGFVVGIATAAAADEGLKWYGRSRQGAEQDAIAAAAGDLAVGESRPWRIRHYIPIGNEHGELRVVRVIANPLATCKEVVFSVVEGSAARPRQNLFTTDVCRQGDTWKWALAEPAVPRWGYLQ